MEETKVNPLDPASGLAIFLLTNPFHEPGVQPLLGTQSQMEGKRQRGAYLIKPKENTLFQQSCISFGRPLPH